MIINLEKGQEIKLNRPTGSIANLFSDEPIKVEANFIANEWLIKYDINGVLNQVWCESFKVGRA